jgi:hypothetical protein
MQKNLVALKLPTHAAALGYVAQTIVDAMTGNASFPDPTPPLTAVTSAIAALLAAEVAAASRTRGTVAVRDERRTALVSLLMQLKAYVQRAADGDPDRAPALIESAGMQLKKAVSPAKPPLAARPGAVAGSLRVSARSAGDRASYDWAWSDDQGASWHRAPATLQARTLLYGLPAGFVAVRQRAVTKSGEGDWSEPVVAFVR